MNEPMIPDDLEALRTDAEEPTDVEPPTWDEVRLLLADRDWHRSRVRVTDDDIRRAGLGDPDICEGSPRLNAWASVNSITHDLDGIFHENGDGEKLIFRGSLMAHEQIINALADAVGRPPLDVLDEILALEPS